MMKIKTLRQMSYEGTFIYIQQFDFIFQYLVVWEKEIFQNHIELKPTWRVIPFFFGLIKTPYNKTQLEYGEQVILAAAMKTIDALKNPGAKQKRREAERKIYSQTNCTWQTKMVTEGKDPKEVPYYYCITHNKFAPIEEDKAPKHE